jgi:hypothetical protein
MLILLALPVTAAADRIYWVNGSKISYANLDGSGGGDLNTGSGTISGARGLTIDPAAGRIYWSNGPTSHAIAYANLDGSGGGDLTIEGVTRNWPTGLAIDPEVGRIYWGNYQGSERIAFADLDGSDGGLVPTTGATANNPTGIALDPEAGRIYWSNENGPVSYAALDGSGGDDIKIEGTETGFFEGVAIDPVEERIYWPSYKGFFPYASVISYAALDESGAANLPTPGATFSFPTGVAIDPVARRIYWANREGAGQIGYVSLDGSGAGLLNTSGATVSASTYPALLMAPAGTGPPQLSRDGGTPEALTCTEGTWAADVPEARFYRAAETIEYRWLRDGVEVPGATQSSFTPTTSGSYACRVTAFNAGGGTPQTSNAVQVNVPVGIAVAARVALVKRGKARLRLRCVGGGACSGVARLTQPFKQRGAVKARLISFGQADFSMAAGQRRVVRVKLSKGARARLRRARRHRIRATLAGRGVQSRTVLLKKARPKRKKRAGR